MNPIHTPDGRFGFTHWDAEDSRVRIMHESGWSIRRMAKELGRAQGTVRRRLVFLGLVPPVPVTRRSVGRCVLTPEKQEAIRSMTAAGWGKKRIARAIDSDPATVRRWRIALGLAPRTEGTPKADLPNDVLRERLLNGVPYSRIAGEFGTSIPTVLRRARRLGLDLCRKTYRTGRDLIGVLSAAGWPWPIEGFPPGLTPLAVTVCLLLLSGPKTKKQIMHAVGRTGSFHQGQIGRRRSILATLADHGLVVALRAGWRSKYVVAYSLTARSLGTLERAAERQGVQS